MTDTITHSPAATAWKGYEKFAFRLFFIYFFLQVVPLDWKYYTQLFSIDWARLHYGAIFDLAHYAPRWSSGAQRYIDWVFLLGIAGAGAIVWTVIDGRRYRVAAYDNLYYWIRVIVRYRLAIGMIAYGFIKLFPLLSPYPSLSNLNTNYGDFTRWKLFSLSLGIVPSYESFLGGVEIIGGLLLFYRKSASVGAFIIVVFLGNVFMSNLAYGGGDDVYSLYLISLALFVLSYDAQRLADLLIFQRPARSNRFHPAFREKGQRYARLALKAGFIFFFVVLYGFKTRYGYERGSYQFPTSKGLPGAAGVYNVSQFVIGKDTLAYSKTDSTRWQDVVFEKWATLSIRSNRPVVLDSANTERPELTGDDRDYELEGSAGRNYYSYTIDSVGHTLTLQNKNPHYTGERWVLHYDRAGEGRIVLSGVGLSGGIGSGKDSVYAVLDKIDKKYLLEEAGKKGRQGGLSL
jgi:hypothetical protein